MESKNVTFNDVPMMLLELKHDIDFIKAHLLNKTEHEHDWLFTIEQLMDYIPEHPARQTCYQWIYARLIPYEKHGRRLYFRKSDIDNWLNNGRRI